MLRISHAVVIAALLALPTVMLGQDDSKGRPAPGEPSGSADSADTANAATPTKYHRDATDGVAPTPDTEPTSADAADDAAAESKPADLQAEIKALRAELAQLKADFKALRADYDELDAAVADHAKSLKSQTDGLAHNAKQLHNVQAEQETLAGKISDLSKAGQTRSAAKIPSDLVDDAASREELLRNMRYRLRIHNTTGVEQRLTIDGRDWMVRADEWSFVPIANGPVTVRRQGHEPLRIAGNPDQWQSDKRGFYIDYDLDGNQLEQPETP